MQNRGAVETPVQAGEFGPPMQAGGIPLSSYGSPLKGSEVWAPEL